MEKSEHSKIIAFGHQKQVGKDTAARFLNTILRIAAPHLIVKHVSFAAKLKDISFQLFKWADLKPGIYYESHPEAKEIVLPKYGASPRAIWIAVGNKLREVYPSVWIDYALKNIDAHIIIISDLRFINEATAVRSANGTLIKIERLSVLRGNDPAEVDLLGWTDWDKVIENHGTLDDLNTQMERLAETILKSCSKP